MIKIIVGKYLDLITIRQIQQIFYLKLISKSWSDDSNIANITIITYVTQRGWAWDFFRISADYMKPCIIQ